MTETTEILDDFSPILIENYIRTKTAVKNISNLETGNIVAATFKISKEFYQQLINGEYLAPLIGLDLQYDEEKEVLSVFPNQKFMEQYKNQIMSDVAVQQAEKLKGRYSRFIEYVE